MLYLIILILNMAAFGILYFVMPEVTLLAFITISLLVPIVYNCFLYKKLRKQSKTKHSIMLLSIITTVSYFIFGQLIKDTSKLELFITNNNYNSGNLMVHINENIVGGSQIVFILLLQICCLYIFKFVTKGEKNDSSH